MVNMLKNMFCGINLPFILSLMASAFNSSPCIESQLRPTYVWTILDLDAIICCISFLCVSRSLLVALDHFLVFCNSWSNFYNQ
jgi:hypothetical protein